MAVAIFIDYPVRLNSLVDIYHGNTLNVILVIQYW